MYLNKGTGAKTPFGAAAAAAAKGWFLAPPLPQGLAATAMTDCTTA